MRCLRHRVTKEEKREEKKRLGERRSSSTHWREYERQQEQSEKKKKPSNRLVEQRDRLAKAAQPAGWLAGRASKAEASRAERGGKQASVAANPRVTRSTSLQLLRGNAGVTAIIFMVACEIIISYFA